MSDKLKKIIRGIIVVFIIIILAGIFFGDDEKNQVSENEGNQVNKDENVVLEEKVLVEPFIGKISCQGPKQKLDILNTESVYEISKDEVKLSIYSPDRQNPSKPPVESINPVLNNDGNYIKFQTTSPNGQKYTNQIGLNSGNYFTDFVPFKPDERNFKISLDTKCSVIE